MTLAGYNLQDNVYIYSNNKCMCVFLISPVPIAEPLTSELIDTPVFYNLAPRPIKYRVSVPIPTHKHEFSTIFSNFQTLLVTFFHKRYILTNKETFVRQTLAIIELEDLAFSWAFSYISLRQFSE